MYFNDIIGVILAFLLSRLVLINYISTKGVEYNVLLILVILSQCIATELSHNFKGVFDRGQLSELKAVVIQTFLCFMLTVLALFVGKISTDYSRVFMGVFVATQFVFVYVLRINFKVIIKL